MLLQTTGLCLAVAVAVLLFLLLKCKDNNFKHLDEASNLHTRIKRSPSYALSFL